jgi:aspartate kinase
VALIVQKFGGTSVGSLERIQNVAEIVSLEQKKNNQVVVVVSAMAGETNRLVALAQGLDPEPNRLALDMILASGEQVSCGLLAIALEKRGIKALPLLAFQAGIKTNEIFTDARIESIHTELLKKNIDRGVVPIVAGFQGIFEDEDKFEYLTTLGRGGSDTSGVALAAALKADRCDIYTDVAGVYTADPRIVQKAKPIDEISFSEMMELASLGAKVLHMRSVEIAAKYKVPLRVCSTFEPEKKGTYIIGEENMIEAPVVSSITSSLSECLIKMTVKEIDAQFPARILKPLADAHINIDIILRSANNNGFCTFNLSCPRSEMNRTLEILKSYTPSVVLEKAAKLSIVGVGMKTHSGVAAKMFEALEKIDVPIQLITTSEIKVSVVIAEKDLDRSIVALHTVFGLDKNS